MDFNFGNAFDSAMEWLVSDSGSQVVGAAIGAGGEYYAQKEVTKMQNKHQKELSKQEHDQRLQFNDHQQEQKDERNQWVGGDLSGLDYTMGADRTLSGQGVLSVNPNASVLQRLRG